MLATTLVTVPIWLAALLGAWVYRHAAGAVSLCLVPTLYSCALHLVFVSSVRYRVPGVPFLCILAGAGFVWLGGKVVGGRWGLG